MVWQTVLGRTEDALAFPVGRFTHCVRMNVFPVSFDWSSDNAGQRPLSLPTITIGATMASKLSVGIG